MSPAGPAIVDRVIAELDVIEVRLPVGSWDVGTGGTVHEVRSDGLLVEISDDDGAMRDLITVSVEAAEVVWSMDERKNAETSQDVQSVPKRPGAVAPESTSRSGRR